MSIILGEYSCKHCGGIDFKVLRQQKKDSLGTKKVMVLRCEKCREVFDIGATTSHILNFNQTKR